jgi:protein-S-isoprenylcysteine O-methyltransferase Ste14
MLFTTLLGYFLLLIFFYMERRLRRSEYAKSLDTTEFDRRTTRFLGYAFIVSILALLAAWLLNALDIGHMPQWVAWLGIVLALCGLFMRAWAMRSLGTSYTRTLRVAQGQHIVQDGPYRYIRHPGYLGMILTWIGASAATGNWIVLLIVFLVISAAYHNRIYHEEEMLLSKLPGYEEYRSHTWRLLPPIY